MQIYKKVFRPLLFRFSPEKAQALTDFLLKGSFLESPLSYWFDYSNPRLAVSAGNIKYPSPVGIAAGYDKDCRLIDGLLSLGFGYVVAGTVTREARLGNPSPRLLRLPSSEAVINALGFPGKGLKAARSHLERSQMRRLGNDKPVIASVSGLKIQEFQDCQKTLEPFVDGIELNVSSPNTDGIRMFQEPDNFETLIRTLNQGRNKPMLVKMPPFFDERGKERILRLVNIAAKEGVDGITAANTHPIKEVRLAMGHGGLSGRPLFKETLEIVREIRLEVGKDMAVHACGGIFTYEDVIEAFRVGADTVQLFTGLVYEGPSVAKNINLGLIKYMDEQGIETVRDLVK
tara:strand:- start:98 stop:1132 length:1035 start_codon:yes stop_codon:yes gene_type:complete